MRRRAGNTTLAHYETHAALYADLLNQHDSTSARRRFLDAIGGKAPHILDLGCGAGRDLAGFQADGARSVGVDGAPALATIAAERSGCPVHVLDLLSPTMPPWPARAFDGIWAHHVLFHMPGIFIPGILARLHSWLRPGGMLYACDPTGDGTEGLAADGRFIALRRPQSWKAMVRAGGFTLQSEWRRPEGLPRHRQGWLATIWQRDRG